MAYNFHYTPTGTGAISGKEVLEQTEDAINDLGNTAISGVQEALDKAEQALTNSENAVDDAQTALNTANNAEGVAIQARTDVGNLSGTVTNIGNRVTTAEGNIGNLQGRMTTAEGNIGNLQGRMTTAEGNIGNLQTAVSTAQATANSAQQTATTARQQSYVFRYSSTALTDSSTNSNTLLDNTDNLKVGDKVIDSSGVIYSVTAIDTANSTFTIGTALIDLAQDSDVVHKSGDETVGGNKEFTGTTTAHDVIPSAIDTYNLGSPSYQWNNAYIKSLTINGVACGDILTHNVSEFVDVTSNQTIGGVKTFTSSIGISKGSGDVELAIKNTSLALKTNTNSGMDDIRFIDKDNLIVGGLRQSFTNSKVTGTVYSRSYSSDGNSYTQVEFNLITDNQNDIGDAYVKCHNFYPNPNATINLGTSTNKWKTINGVEPSALGMPDLDNGIDISSYITHLDKVVNQYTPPANGYIYIRVKKTSLPIVSIRMQQLYGLMTSCETSDFSTWGTYLPVVAGNAVEFYISADSLAGAIFFPCQGNV